MGKRKWCEASAFEEAKKFKTRMELNKVTSGAYDYLWERGLLDAACVHMGEKVRWSFESALETAIFYGSLELFRKNEPGAYSFVHREGRLEELKEIAGFPKRALKYTDDDIVSAGKSYATKKEFERGNPNMCKLAYTRKLMHLVSAHMEPGCFAYTKKELMDIAYRCSRKSEFAKLYPGAYSAAWRDGLLDELCQHMPDGGGGFRRDMPGRVYQIKFQYRGKFFWKHGITNTTVAARLKGFGLKSGVKWWIEKVVYFENGGDAAVLEGELKRKARPYSGAPFMKNGFTEVSTGPLLA